MKQSAKVQLAMQAIHETAWELSQDADILTEILGKQGDTISDQIFDLRLAEEKRLGQRLKRIMLLDDDHARMNLQKAVNQLSGEIEEFAKRLGNSVINIAACADEYEMSKKELRKLVGEVIDFAVVSAMLNFRATSDPVLHDKHLCLYSTAKV